ncbi:MAG: aminoglycoside phosphotransferase family protein [Polyangiaceae bacterium]
MSARDRARRRWAVLEGGTTERITRGLINETHRVESPAGRFILQRLHPVFDPAMHQNIAAVTEHLAQKGMVTPLLVPTDDGALFVDLGDDGVWRSLTHVTGHNFVAAESPTQLASAAELVGRFHAAVADLDHAFVGLRAGVHDTDAHLATLRAALAEHRAHRLHPDVAPLAHQLFSAYDDLGPLPDLPPRIGHGDLKLSNVMFAGDEPPASAQAVCLIDLDTLGPMALAHELGDAWRSWCNPNREDATEAHFDLELFEASWRGYVAGYAHPVSIETRRALLLGVEHIILELTARFLADALREEYFGWNADRYPSRGDHNLVRARGQWSLFQAARACRDDRASILDL